MNTITSHDILKDFDLYIFQDGNQYFRIEDIEIGMNKMREKILKDVENLINKRIDYNNGLRINTFTDNKNKFASKVVIFQLIELHGEIKDLYADND